MSTRVFNKADAVLTNEEIVFICRALEDDQLKVLCLRACTVRSKDLKRILQLAGPCGSLQQLTLNIGMLTTVRHIELLARCLCANSSLTGLHIHGSDLGDMGMKILGLALSKHPGIVSLDVGDCKLSDMSIDVLYSLLLPLGNKSGLTELTLSDNPHISALGWAQFGMCLANCSCLRWLFLDYNPLGDYGASCVLVALAASQSVQVLDLEGCGLTEHTGQTILHLVQNHLGGLSQVKLSNNRIRTSTVESIRKHLSDNQLDDSCSLSTLSAEDLFFMNETKLPSHRKTYKYNKSSSSSSSSSKDSGSDSDSSSDDDSKKHCIQKTQKHTKITGKRAQSKAEKQAGKKQKKGLKDKIAKIERMEKQKDKSEKQNDDSEKLKNKSEKQNDDSEKLKNKSEKQNDDSEKLKNKSEKQNDDSEKLKNKSEKQNDDSEKLKNKSEKQNDDSEKLKNKSEKQNHQQSTGMEGTCKKDERDNNTHKPKQYSKQGEMGEKKGKHSKPCIKCSRSNEDSDDRETNSDKDPSTDDSDNAGDELQEVPVFYK